MRKPWYHIFYTKSPLAKIIWAIVGTLISLAALLFQTYVEEPRMKAQTANWSGRSIEKGAELFASNCSNCHGLDGKGLPGVAPALQSKYFFTQRIVDVGFAGTLHDYVALTVAGGRPSMSNRHWAQMMPTWSGRFGGPLREDQVDHVVNFVMNWRESAIEQTAEADPFQCFPGVPTKPQEGDKSPQALGIKTCTADGIALLPGQAPPPTAAVTTTVSGPRPPQELFVAMGCSACHKLDQEQTPDNLGQPGPNMKNLPQTAATKVSGQDAETYVRTSIGDPGAFVNEGYANGIMPPNFKERMSEEEINSLAKWLLDPNRPQ